MLRTQVNMRALVVSLVLASALSACAAPAGSSGARSTGPATGAAATSAPAATPTTTAGPRPAFLTYAFTDVRDGKSFTLTDFPGKTVLVIGMAVW